MPTPRLVAIGTGAPALPEKSKAEEKIISSHSGVLVDTEDITQFNSARLESNRYELPARLGSSRLVSAHLAHLGSSRLISTAPQLVSRGDKAASLSLCVSKAVVKHTARLCHKFCRDIVTRYNSRKPPQTRPQEATQEGKFLSLCKRASLTTLTEIEIKERA